MSLNTTCNLERQRGEDGHKGAPAKSGGGAERFRQVAAIGSRSKLAARPYKTEVFVAASKT